MLRIYSTIHATAPNVMHSWRIGDKKYCLPLCHGAVQKEGSFGERSIFFKMFTARNDCGV